MRTSYTQQLLCGAWNAPCLAARDVKLIVRGITFIKQ